MTFSLLVFLSVVHLLRGESDDAYFQKNRQIARTLIEIMQDARVQKEVLFDLEEKYQALPNTTLSVVIKYIVKRNVDSTRKRRSDAIGRRIYSSLAMKLIDIAKDLPRNRTAVERIATAAEYYRAAAADDTHDKVADSQVFHQVKRLYDVLVQAPKLLNQLGDVDDLTPRLLIDKLREIHVQPVHLAVAVLTQYHLRSIMNFALQDHVVNILAAQPHKVGHQVIEMVKRLAAMLLPVSELLDVHLAHSASFFSDECPKTWLGIVKSA